MGVEFTWPTILRVWGSGSRIEGVQGVDFRPHGAGFRVMGITGEA